MRISVCETASYITEAQNPKAKPGAVPTYSGRRPDEPVHQWLRSRFHYCDAMGRPGQ